MIEKNTVKVLREWRDVRGQLCRIIRRTGKDTKYVTDKNGYVWEHDVTPTAKERGLSP